tara:strand:+ start:764 stop:943 length:180 start_codon:yes stop_codon:yes gene_type:complete
MKPQFESDRSLKVELPLEAAKEILQLLDDNNLLYDYSGGGAVLKPAIVHLERYVSFNKA